MEVVLAWAVYLSLGTSCLALAWARLAPRLSRRTRLAVLGLFAGLSVLALVIASQVPHDYRPSNLVDVGRAGEALFTELVVALIGGASALARIGRKRAGSAALCGVGVYVAGTGLILYLMLNGESSLQAPLLVLVGLAVAIGAASRIAGSPGWLSVAAGMVGGLAGAIEAEALRGSELGSLGGGPATAPREVLILLGAGAAFALLAAILLVRAHRRAIVGPLCYAAIALVGTGIVLVLRGPGEWLPGPGAPSTTLYGLPLTLIAVAASLAILNLSARTPSRQPPEPNGGHWGVRHRKSAWPVIAGPLLLLGIVAVWHPSLERCAATPYSDTSAVASTGPSWVSSPDPAAPRGAPDVASFARACIDRAASLTELAFAIFPGCKWAQVDGDYPLVQAGGILRHIDLSNADSPWIHTSHDLEMDIATGPASAWLVLGGQDGALLHVEVEAGSFPVDFRPIAGDRVTVAGRWIFDCGHDPHTEIHPAAVVASEHDEWSDDMEGGPQRVRVLRVWMNSRPGLVRVPLAPFDMQAEFPSRPAGQDAVPVVKVVAGSPGEVRSTISDATGAASQPEAALRFAPPASDRSAYFELLLGYRRLPLVPPQPISYTVVFDRLQVRDNLRREARNTARQLLGGIPIDVINPQLGLPGTGRWFMQAIVDHTWRQLLDGVSVENGQELSLSAVPSVPILAPGDEHLRLSITGYADNDPSDGVELASGRVDGAGIRTWDLGQLSTLSGDAVHSFTPPHAAWTLFYRLHKAAHDR